MKYNADINGYMSLTELEWLYDMASKMDSIVEIGTYEGRSTFSLLSGCKGLVYSVDIYDKRITTIDTLMNMVRNIGHFKNFRFLKMLSEEAVKYFADNSIDMVFIDGDHLYDSVKSDIERWMVKTKKLICGHDYGDVGWPGVKMAVDEKFNDVKIVDTIWFKNL
jgi:predicted O-methyltransferase YrrM